MSRTSRSRRPRAGSRLASVIAACVPALTANAHHSSAIFDLERAVTIEGLVTAYEWANPHVYLYVDTGAADAEPAVWEVEASPPAFMALRGWSPETFSPGDRVVIEGFAAKRVTARMALGLFATTADGRRLVMSRNGPTVGGADADPLFAELPDPEPASGIAGTWVGLPPNRDLVRQFLFDADAWPLSSAGRAAFDGYDDSENPAAACIDYTAPFSMVMPNVKVIEFDGSRIAIATGVTGDGSAERVIHTNAASREDVPYTNQGHSIGRWDGDTLVVDTARFEARPSGNAMALASSRQKQLVERFALSDDGKRLRYTFELSDPQFLAEPVRGETIWTHSPGSGLIGGECKLENARRYLDAWAE